VELRLLGPLEFVGDDGQPIALPAGKPRALLGLLGLETGHVVSLDRIVDILWSGRPPTTAPKVVQSYVSRLRKLLPTGVLVTRRPGYLLRLDHGQFDLARFERLRDEAAVESGRGRHRVAVARFGEALALWRGPPLADVADELDLGAELARLDELRMVTWEERFDSELALGRHGVLVAELEAALSAHPLRERLAGQLMLALYRSGRQADALAVYREMRARLVDELGLHPSQALQRLEQAILRQDSSLDLFRTTDVPSPAPVSAPRSVKQFRVCARCGAENAPDARFCQSCAEPLVAHEPVEVRKTVTVVVCSLVALTDAGDRLDPESLRGVRSRFVELAAAVFEGHGGTVEKSIGVELIAVFGVPAVHEDDALRAVRAGTELRERVTSLNAELGSESGVDLRLQIGVATGEAIVDEGSRDPHPIGDAVNVAARLEQTAAPWEILLSEQTHRLVQQAVVAEALEPLVLKGRVEPVPVYRLVVLEEATSPVPDYDSPFVGRGDQLARLTEAFERVVTERVPALLTIIGPAGIGKTRLAAEFTSTLGERASVVHGCCVAYGEGITFWPLEQIVRSLPGLPAGAPDPAQADSIEITFWAYRKLFQQLATEQPLVLVLDDLHWAESTLLDLLEHIIEWTRDAPLLLLCLARHELVETRPDWPGERLELEPLPDEELELLLFAVSGDLPAPERSRIAQAAEGNPFFAEQMAVLAREEERRETSVAPSIQALLEARLDRLAEEERSLLELASVVGNEFWRNPLIELSPPGTAVSAILQRLIRKRLLRHEHSNVFEEDAFRFAHVLIRDASYSAIPKKRRADLHAGLADWLERTDSSLREIVGFHLEQAYLYRTQLGPVRDTERKLALRAGKALAEAGEAAAARGDTSGAANLLSRGLTLLPGDSPGRGELLLTLGDALKSLGDAKEAFAVYEDALAAAEATADRGLAWEATLERSALEYGLSPGTRPREEYLKEAEEAAVELEALGHTTGLIRACNRLSWGEYYVGHYRAAGDAAERAAALARREGAKWLERASLFHVGFLVYYGPTPASEGIRRCEEILVESADDILVRPDMHRYLSGFHAMLGQSDEARRLHELALAESADLGRKGGTAAIEMLLLALQEILEPAEAERKLRHSFALLEEMGFRSASSTSAARLARCLCTQGRYDEAEEYAAMGESLAPPDDVATYSVTRAARARVAAHRGDLEQAEALARKAVVIADRNDDIDQRGWIRVDLADILGLAAKVDQAREALNEALRLAEQKEDLLLVDQVRTRLPKLQSIAQ
jgi:class 3 adenylate cyclase/DNA-binding SARP family transcriptional activator